MEKGSNFLRNSDIVEEGDTVVVYVNAAAQYSVVVKRGHTLHMKYGALRHEFLIGKRINPSMWTRTLQKSTQILYTPDIGTILLLLDVKPGARICETGTGSGSLSHAIATAVAPDGHLYSFDIDEKRVKTVQNDLKLHGLSQNATVHCRDVSQHGFATTDCADKDWFCDGVFLDLPAPWLAIGHAHKVLFQNGPERRPSRLVSFSPCIEQVQRVCAELEQHGFVDIETVEVVPRKLKVVDMPCESLSEYAAKGANAQTFFQKESQQNNTDCDQQRQKGRRGAKRKADNAGEETKMEEDADTCENGLNGKVAAASIEQETDGPQTVTDAMPFPFTQPTHTGYLTSATLLPRIDGISKSTDNVMDLCAVVPQQQTLSTSPQQ
ncbi:hypothetical protein niasHT_028540 [Heterodera trifolii]|uniref:tRNA (adenine(58)-N(1))-methyltransferase catalytic subunit TRMT61A n=1 Tax=Heterodera trifolii TaxID=157864 RepID=A0ABD2KQ87_9BILA